MSVAEKQFIAFDYVLTLDSGEEIDRSEENEPLDFITGQEQIIPSLEKSLMAMKVGESSKVTIEPEDGYGTFNQELIQEIPRDQFPPEEKLEAGMSFQTEGPQGPLMINIVEVKGDESVTIDLNHPLAGKTLVFDVKIVEAREANSEEIARLTAAGCGCGSESQAASCGTDCACAADGQDKGGGCGCS